MTYGKGLTPVLKLAQRGGAARLADGVGMLAEQAAEAFAWWRGVRPATAEVIRMITVPLV
jgi:shikimate dehydrogenase